MDITINELAQLLAARSNAEAKEQRHIKHPYGQHIVVLDRGYVYVGDVDCDDDYVHISNAKNIRVWGTLEGLGQLRNGPLSSTKLDVVGKVVVHHHAVKHFIPCSGF